MKWYLEIVYAIFGKKYFTEGKPNEEPNKIERESLRLHIMGMSRFYCVLTSDLDGPLTPHQTSLLEQAKANGDILDYCARQAVGM